MKIKKILRRFIIEKIKNSNFFEILAFFYLEVLRKLCYNGDGRSYIITNLRRR